MNKLIVAVVVFSAVIAHAVEADYVEGEKSADLITPEISMAASQMLGGENALKLLHAIRLQMTKYDLDMRSDSGRRNWHGSKIREEIHTNDLFKVEVYSNSVDGTVWRYAVPFKPVDVRQYVDKYNAKLPKPPMTNGVPVALAEARMRRYAEKNTVSNVTETITVGGAR